MTLTAKMLWDDRVAGRTPVELGGTLRDDAWNPVDVLIEDLSTTGFLMRSTTSVAPGDLVTIGIAGIGLRPARVVRKTDAGFGCQFIDPIAPAAVANAVRAETVIPVSFRQPEFAIPIVRDAETNATEEHKLPLQVRMWAIIGSAVVTWVIAAAVIALIVLAIR